MHSVILSLAYEVTPFLPSRWTGTLSGNLTKMAERKWSPVGSKSAGLWFLRACLGLESRRGIIGPGDRPLEPPPPGGDQGGTRAPGLPLPTGPVMAKGLGQAVWVK